MQVIISVGGRWHAFYLAQQLLKRGYLKKLITSYPKFEVMRYGIPKDKISSIIVKEILERGWKKMPIFVKKLYNPQFFVSELFDRLASKKIVKSDIFVGWSGFSLHSLRKARELGAITVIERCSSHMLYQLKILSEEYEKFGLKFNNTHPKIIEKELQEYEEADYIAIPSRFVKRTFIEKGIPENKLILIPYGVDLKEFSQITKEDDIFRVIYAGGITLRKGVHYLLQAFSELRLPNSELLLVGGISGELKSFFKKYKGSYKWIGHKPQKELYKYYSQGSVFVMPSIEEGMAYVQAQAMACGLPLICTTNTGGEDLIQDGVSGFVIPIRNVEVLKEKLIYLYENPMMCRVMGQSAKERISVGFTWNDYGERIIGQYQKLLNQEKEQALIKDELFLEKD